MPDINLFLPWTSPFYRLVFAFGAVTDFVYDHNNFITCEGATQSIYKTLPWQLASRTSDAQGITLRLKKVIDPEETLLVAAGIEMGTPTFDSKVDEVPHQGAAIILRVG